MNEVLTVFARRCRERGRPQTFAALTGKLLDAIPETAVTWLYPHVPRWFTRCAETMRDTAGAVNFHDALLAVAAGELGFRAIVTFDTSFDRLAALQRLGSAGAVERWLRAGRRS